MGSYTKHSHYAHYAQSKFITLTNLVYLKYVSRANIMQKKPSTQNRQAGTLASGKGRSTNKVDKFFSNIQMFETI